MLPLEATSEVRGKEAGGGGVGGDMSTEKLRVKNYSTQINRERRDSGPGCAINYKCFYLLIFRWTEKRGEEMAGVCSVYDVEVAILAALLPSLCSLQCDTAGRQLSALLTCCMFSC